MQLKLKSEFSQGAKGPGGDKGSVGDFGEDGNIIIIRDPKGGPGKEFVIWVNLISEIINKTKLAEKGEKGLEVSSF